MEVKAEIINGMVQRKGDPEVSISPILRSYVKVYFEKLEKQAIQDSGENRGTAKISYHPEIAKEAERMDFECNCRIAPEIMEIVDEYRDLFGYHMVLLNSNETEETAGELELIVGDKSIKGFKLTLNMMPAGQSEMEKEGKCQEKN